MEKYREEKISIVWRVSTRAELAIRKLESFCKFWSCCMFNIKEKYLHSQGILYLFSDYFLGWKESMLHSVSFELFTSSIYTTNKKTRVRTHLFLVEQRENLSIFWNQNCKPFRLVAHFYRKLELKYRSILKCENQMGSWSWKFIYVFKTAFFSFKLKVVN